MSSDPLFLRYLNGDFLEFNSIPCCEVLPPNLKLAPSEQAALDCTINDFLLHDVVEVCSPTTGPCYYSPYFPIIKSDGSARFILNLRDFNLTVEYIQFKMDTM